MAHIKIRVAGETTQLQKDIKKALRSGGYQLGSLDGKKFTQPLGRIKGQLGEFEKSMEAANARVIAFGASTGAIYAVATAIREMVAATIEVEKTLTEINTILGATQSNLSSFGDTLFSVANATGQSFKTVAEAANELARQGLGIESTLARTRDAMILSRIAGLDAASAVTALTAVMNGFTKAAYESNEVVNKMAAVDAAFAVSSADLAEAIKRVGSTASEAGVSLEELLSIVAATQQVTARGGAVIGNSFKTIFTRMQRPRVLDTLESLGVHTKNQQGASLGLMKVMGNLANKYDKLDARQKSVVAEMVGGVFQVNVLKAGLGDLNKEVSLYSTALKIAANASDEANDRNDALNQTLSSQLIKTMNNLVRVGAKVGELTFAPAMEKSLKGINAILGEGVGDESMGAKIGGKIAKGLLSGLGSVISGPGIAFITLGIMKLFQKLISFAADAGGSMLGFNNASKQQANIQAQVLSYLKSNPAAIAAINSGLLTEKQLHADILGMVRDQANEMEDLSRIAGKVATKMGRSGYGVAGAGPTEGMIMPRGGYSKGYVPNLSDQAYEESNARKLGASRSVRATYLPDVKAGGSKGVMANNQEEIISPKKLQEKYGVTPKGGESAIVPKYGLAGMKVRKELESKVRKAQKPINLASGFTPNFVDMSDIERWRKADSEGKITRANYKKGKRASSQQKGPRKPSIAQMVQFLNQDMQSLPDKEIKDYASLYNQGVIRGNMTIGGKPAPDRVKEKFREYTGQKIGTDETKGITKNEKTRTPINVNQIEEGGRLLPVLQLETQKGLPKVDEGSVRFGLLEKQIPKLEENFNKEFQKEYQTMVGNVGTKMFRGLKDQAAMQKAFKPQELAVDAQGPVKGAVWESFVRGMIKNEKKQISGQRVDVQTGKVRKEFTHLFPEQLRDKPFEIKAGEYTREEARDKMRASGISMSVDEIGDFIGPSGTRMSPQEARILAQQRRSGVVKTPNLAEDLTKGGPTSRLQRMVLDADHLRNYYASLPPQEAENLLAEQGVKNVKQLYNKMATSAQAAGKNTTLINAAPGAGKTSFAIGNKGTPISTLDDLERGSKLVMVRAVEQGENLVKEEYFAKADRVIHLDVPAEEIERRRGLRDKEIVEGKSKTSFGREVGSTMFAGKDFSPAEARVAEEFTGTRGKFQSLRAVEEGGEWKWKRKDFKDIEKITDTPIAMTAGAFSPPHKGHGKLMEAALKEAEKTGAVPIAAVSKGEGRTGDVGLTIGEKRKLIEDQYTGMRTISASGIGGIPEVIRGPEGNLIRAKRGESKVFLGSDRVDDSVGERFRKKGFEVSEVARDLKSEGMETDALSATKVRAAILEGRQEEVKSALDTRIAERLTRPENVRIMNKRAAVIEEYKQKESGIKDLVSLEFQNLTKLAVSKGLRAPTEKPITRLVGKVTKTDDPEIVASIGRIKDLRDNEKRRLKSHYNKRVSLMAREEPISMAQGFVPNFALKDPGYGVITSLESGKQSKPRQEYTWGVSLGRMAKKMPESYDRFERAFFGKYKRYPDEKGKKYKGDPNIQLELTGGIDETNVSQRGAWGAARREIHGEIKKDYNTLTKADKRYITKGGYKQKQKEFDQDSKDGWSTAGVHLKKRAGGKFEDYIEKITGSPQAGFDAPIDFPSIKNKPKIEVAQIIKDAEARLSFNAAKSPKNVGKWIRGRAKSDESILKLMNQEPQKKEGDAVEERGRTRRGRGRPSLGGGSKETVGTSYPSNKEFTVDQIAKLAGVSKITAFHKVKEDLKNGILEVSDEIRGKGRPTKLYKKTRAEGYVPNFALADVFNAARQDQGKTWHWEKEQKGKEKGIAAAMNREKSFGNRAEVLWSDRVQGPVVVNDKQIRKYGKNADRIISKDHIERGQGGSKANLMKTGSGKEMYSDGYVPNFQGDMFGAMGLGMMGFMAQFDTLKRIFSKTTRELEDNSRSLEKWQSELGRADRRLAELRQEIEDIASGKAGRIKWDSKQGKHVSDDESAQKTLDRLAAKGKLPVNTYGSASDPRHLADIQSAVDKDRTEILQRQQGRVEKVAQRKERELLAGQDKQEKLELEQQAQDEFKGKISAAMAGVGVGFSVMAGMIKDETSRMKAGMEAVGNSAQMAATAMFMIPGPAGLVVGGITGAYMAFNGIAHAVRDIGPTLKKAAEKNKEELQKMSDGVQKYAQIYQKREQVLEDPNAKSETLVRLNRQMADALMDVPDAYRVQIQSAKNLTEMQNAMAEAMAKKTKQIAQSDFAASFGERLDASSGMPFVGTLMEELGLKGKLTDALGITNKQAYNMKNLESKMALQRGARKIVSSMDDEEIDKLSKRSVTPETAGTQLIPMIKKFGSTTEFLSMALDAAAKNGDAASQMMWQVSKEAKRMADLVASQRNVNKVKEEEIIINDRMKSAVKESVDAYNNATQAYYRFLRLVGRKMTFAGQIRQDRAGAERDVQYKEMDLELKRMAPFVSGDQIERSRDAIALTKLVDKQNREVDKALRPFAMEMAKIISDDVGQIKVQQEKLKEGPAGSRGGAKKLAAEEKARAATAMQTVISEIELKEITTGASALEVIKNRRTLLESPGAQQVFGSKVQLLLEKIASAEQKQIEKLATMDVNQLRSFKELVAVNINNEKMRRDKADLRVQGGVEAFLDPKALQPIIKNLKQGARKMGLGSISQAVGGRGSLQMAKGLKGFFGEASAQDPLMKSLRQQAIQGRMQDMEMNFRGMRDWAIGEAGKAQARGDTQGASFFEKIAQRAQERSKDEEGLQRVAVKQVDKELKLPNTVIGNLKKMTELLDKIHKAQTLQKTESKQATSEAYNRAATFTPQEAQNRRAQLMGYMGRSQSVMEGTFRTQEMFKDFFSGLREAASQAGGQWDESLKEQIGNAEKGFYFNDLQKFQLAAAKIFGSLKTRAQNLTKEINAGGLTEQEKKTKEGQLSMIRQYIGGGDITRMTADKVPENSRLGEMLKMTEKASKFFQHANTFVQGWRQTDEKGKPAAPLLQPVMARPPDQELGDDRRRAISEASRRAVEAEQALLKNPNDPDAQKRFREETANYENMMAKARAQISSGGGYRSDLCDCICKCIRGIGDQITGAVGDISAYFRSNPAAPEYAPYPQNRFAGSVNKSTALLAIKPLQAAIMRNANKIGATLDKIQKAINKGFDKVKGSNIARFIAQELKTIREGGFKQYAIGLQTDFMSGWQTGDPLVKATEDRAGFRKGVVRGKSFDDLIVRKVDASYESNLSRLGASLNKIVDRMKRGDTYVNAVKGIPAALGRMKDGITQAASDFAFGWKSVSVKQMFRPEGSKEAFKKDPRFDEVKARARADVTDRINDALDPKKLKVAKDAIKYGGRNVQHSAGDLFWRSAEGQALAMEHGGKEAAVKASETRVRVFDKYARATDAQIDTVRQSEIDKAVEREIVKRAGESRSERVGRALSERFGKTEFAKKWRMGRELGKAEWGGNIARRGDLLSEARGAGIDPDNLISKISKGLITGKERAAVSLENIKKGFKDAFKGGMGEGIKTVLSKIKDQLGNLVKISWKNALGLKPLARLVAGGAVGGAQVLGANLKETFSGLARGWDLKNIDVLNARIQKLTAKIANMGDDFISTGWGEGLARDVEFFEENKPKAKAKEKLATLEAKRDALIAKTSAGEGSKTFMGRTMEKIAGWTRGKTDTTGLGKRMWDSAKYMVKSLKVHGKLLLKTAKMYSGFGPGKANSPIRQSALWSPLKNLKRAATGLEADGSKANLTDFFDQMVNKAWNIKDTLKQGWNTGDWGVVSSARKSMSDWWNKPGGQKVGKFGGVTDKLSLAERFPRMTKVGNFFSGAMDRLGTPGMKNLGRSGATIGAGFGVNALLGALEESSVNQITGGPGQIAKAFNYDFMPSWATKAGRDEEAGRKPGSRWNKDTGKWEADAGYDPLLHSRMRYTGRDLAFDTGLTGAAALFGRNIEVPALNAARTGFLTNPPTSANKLAGTAGDIRTGKIGAATMAKSMGMGLLSYRLGDFIKSQGDATSMGWNMAGGAVQYGGAAYSGTMGVTPHTRGAWGIPDASKLKQAKNWKDFKNLYSATRAASAIPTMGTMAGSASGTAAATTGTLSKVGNVLRHARGAGPVGAAASSIMAVFDTYEWQDAASGFNDEMSAMAGHFDKMGDLNVDKMERFTSFLIGMEKNLAGVSKFAPAFTALGAAKGAEQNLQGAFFRNMGEGKKATMREMGHTLENLMPYTYPGHIADLAGWAGIGEGRTWDDKMINNSAEEAVDEAQATHGAAVNETMKELRNEIKNLAKHLGRKDVTVFRKDAEGKTVSKTVSELESILKDMLNKAFPGEGQQKELSEKEMYKMYDQQRLKQIQFGDPSAAAAEINVLERALSVIPKNTADMRELGYEKVAASIRKKVGDKKGESLLDEAKAAGRGGDLRGFLKERLEKSKEKFEKGDQQQKLREQEYAGFHARSLMFRGSIKPASESAQGTQIQILTQILKAIREDSDLMGLSQGEQLVTSAVQRGQVEWLINRSEKQKEATGKGAISDEKIEEARKLLSQNKPGQAMQVLNPPAPKPEIKPIGPRPGTWTREQVQAYRDNIRREKLTGKAVEAFEGGYLAGAPQQFRERDRVVEEARRNNLPTGELEEIAKRPEWLNLWEKAKDNLTAEDLKKLAAGQTWQEKFPDTVPKPWKANQFDDDGNYIKNPNVRREEHDPTPDRPNSGDEYVRSVNIPDEAMQRAIRTPSGRFNEEQMNLLRQRAGMVKPAPASAPQPKTLKDMWGDKDISKLEASIIMDPKKGGELRSNILKHDDAQAMMQSAAQNPKVLAEIKEMQRAMSLGQRGLVKKALMGEAGKSVDLGFGIKKPGMGMTEKDADKFINLANKVDIKTANVGKPDAEAAKRNAQETRRNTDAVQAQTRAVEDQTRSNNALYRTIDKGSYKILEQNIECASKRFENIAKGMYPWMDTSGVEGIMSAPDSSVSSYATVPGAAPQIWNRDRIVRKVIQGQGTAQYDPNRKDYDSPKPKPATQPARGPQITARDPGPDFGQTENMLNAQRQAQADQEKLEQQRKASERASRAFNYRADSELNLEQQKAEHRGAYLPLTEFQTNMGAQDLLNIRGTHLDYTHAQRATQQKPYHGTTSNLETMLFAEKSWAGGKLMAEFEKDMFKEVRQGTDKRSQLAPRINTQKNEPLLERQNTEGKVVDTGFVTSSHARRWQGATAAERARKGEVYQSQFKVWLTQAVAKLEGRSEVKDFGDISLLDIVRVMEKRNRPTTRTDDKHLQDNFAKGIAILTRHFGDPLSARAPRDDSGRLKVLQGLRGLKETDNEGNFIQIVSDLGKNIKDITNKDDVLKFVKARPKFKTFTEDLVQSRPDMAPGEMWKMFKEKALAPDAEGMYKGHSYFDPSEMRQIFDSKTLFEGWFNEFGKLGMMGNMNFQTGMPYNRNQAMDPRLVKERKALRQESGQHLSITDEGDRLEKMREVFKKNFEDVFNKPNLKINENLGKVEKNTGATVTAVTSLGETLAKIESALSGKDDTDLKTALDSQRKQGRNVGQFANEGFIPQRIEESNARTLGAINPKAHWGKGTIGNKRFLMNSEEWEVPNFGSNGDSLVMPTYGQVAKDRTRELINKTTSVGFVPNFDTKDLEKARDVVDPRFPRVRGGDGNLYTKNYPRYIRGAHLKGSLPQEFDKAAKGQTSRGFDYTKRPGWEKQIQKIILRAGGDENHAKKIIQELASGREKLFISVYGHKDDKYTFHDAQWRFNENVLAMHARSVDGMIKGTGKGLGTEHNELTHAVVQEWLYPMMSGAGGRNVLTSESGDPKNYNEIWKNNPKFKELIKSNVTSLQAKYHRRMRNWDEKKSGPWPIKDRITSGYGKTGAISFMEAQSTVMARLAQLDRAEEIFKNKGKASGFVPNFVNVDKIRRAANYTDIIAKPGASVALTKAEIRLTKEGKRDEREFNVKDVPGWDKVLMTLAKNMNLSEEEIKRAREIIGNQAVQAYGTPGDGINIGGFVSMDNNTFGISAQNALGLATEGNRVEGIGVLANEMTHLIQDRILGGRDFKFDEAKALAGDWSKRRINLNDRLTESIGPMEERWAKIKKQMGLRKEGNMWVDKNGKTLFAVIGSGADSLSKINANWEKGKPKQYGEALLERQSTLNDYLVSVAALGGEFRYDPKAAGPIPSPTPEPPKPEPPQLPPKWIDGPKPWTNPKPPKPEPPKGGVDSPHTNNLFTGRYNGRMWFMGLPGAGRKTDPNDLASGFVPNFVDWNFVREREGFKLKGYVPKDKKGKALDKSGVTLGAGVDLGGKTKEYFKDLDEKTLNKISPYFGKKGKTAVDYLTKNPLTLDKDEVAAIGKITKSSELTKIKARYDKDVGKGAFDKLTEAQQTHVVSPLFQYGAAKMDNDKKVKEWWGHVTSGKWEEAGAHLRTWNQKYKTRRGLEADLVSERKDEALPNLSGLKKPQLLGLLRKTTDPKKRGNIYDALGWKRDNTTKAEGFVPNFADMFNPSLFDEVVMPNKPTLHGQKSILSAIFGEKTAAGINTPEEIKGHFLNKENKKQLFEWLRKNPIDVKTDAVGTHKAATVRDGANRKALANKAGMRRLPMKRSLGVVPMDPFSFITNELLWNPEDGYNLDIFKNLKDAWERGKGKRPGSDFKDAATGFIPNFNPILEAAQREHKAGYAWSDIMADTDPRLKTSQNREGWGIYNREEGSLNAGIALAQAAGIDPKSKGAIPNFADKSEADKLDEQLQRRIEKRLKELQEALAKNKGAIEEHTNKSQGLKKAFEDAKQKESKELGEANKARQELEAAKANLEARQNEARDTGDDQGRLTKAREEYAAAKNKFEKERKEAEDAASERHKAEVAYSPAGIQSAQLGIQGDKLKKAIDKLKALDSPDKRLGFGGYERGKPVELKTPTKRNPDAGGVDVPGSRQTGPSRTWMPVSTNQGKGGVVTVDTKGKEKWKEPQYETYTGGGMESQRWGMRGGKGYKDLEKMFGDPTKNPPIAPDFLGMVPGEELKNLPRLLDPKGAGLGHSTQIGGVPGTDIESPVVKTPEGEVSVNPEKVEEFIEGLGPLGRAMNEGIELADKDTPQFISTTGEAVSEEPEKTTPVSFTRDESEPKNRAAALAGQDLDRDKLPTDLSNQTNDVDAKKTQQTLHDIANKNEYKGGIKGLIQCCREIAKTLKELGPTLGRGMGRSLAQFVSYQSNNLASAPDKKKEDAKDVAEAKKEEKTKISYRDILDQISERRKKEKDELEETQKAVRDWRIKNFGHDTVGTYFDSPTGSLGAGPSHPLGPQDALNTEQVMTLVERGSDEEGKIAKGERAAIEKYEDYEEAEGRLVQQVTRARSLADKFPGDQSKVDAYQDALKELEKFRKEQSMVMAERLRYQDPRMQKAKRYEQYGLDFSMDEEGMPEFRAENMGGLGNPMAHSYRTYGDPTFSRELGSLPQTGEMGPVRTVGGDIIDPDENFATNVESYKPRVTGQRAGEAEFWAAARSQAVGIEGIASGRGASGSSDVMVSMKDCICDFKGVLANLGRGGTGAESPVSYSQSSEELTKVLSSHQTATNQLASATGELVTSLTKFANDGLAINNINELYSKIVEGVKVGVSEAYANVDLPEAEETADENTTEIDGELRVPVTHDGAITLALSGGVSVDNIEDIEARIMQKIKAELRRIIPSEFFNGTVTLDPPVEGGTPT